MNSLFCHAKTEKKPVKKHVLTKEEFEKKRWNNIYNLIDEEMKAISKVRKKSQKLQYRLFELKSEKVKLFKEKENKEFVAKKLKYGKKIKRKDIFKKTIRLYKEANAYGVGILKKYPNTRYKAAIFYTLALNSRDFAYDNQELPYLRMAIEHSKGQTKVNYLARTSLAEYYYNNKKWKSAIYQYDIVLKNQDDEWYTKNLLNYGWCLLKTHKFDNAINNLEKSFKLSQDEFYVNVQDQAMTGLISFYVLGKQIQRGVDFINKYSSEKNDALLKLAQKSSGKGYYQEAQKIVESLESTINPAKEPELYADLRLFQFDMYKQFHKPKKLLSIAKLFPKTKFTEYQKEDAIRKVSDIVGAKQVILKKDFSKHDQDYDQNTLNEIVTYFDILSHIHNAEKAQYEYFKAETYYSVHLFKDALETYKVSLTSYDKVKSKEDLRHKNLDAIFSCIDNIKFKKAEEDAQLEYAFLKYLGYWPNDKKAKTIYPRLYGLYLAKPDYENTQIILDRYITHFKIDQKKQQDLFKVMLDKLIKTENTELLARKINLMQKKYLSFNQTEIKKSETILANILFKQLQKLNIEGDHKGALAGYQKIHFTDFYPNAIKGEAAFNMGMIYTDTEDNHNALKWYKKSFDYFTKKEINEKRDFLEKMALRTSLLHNFLNAAKLNKFILTMFCYEKEKNQPIFENAIRNDLANNYITKTLHTIETQKKCVKEIPLSLKKEVMVHLFENDHDSTLLSFIDDHKLEKVYPKVIANYYERYFWSFYESNPLKRVRYLNRLKNLKLKSSKSLIVGLEKLENLEKDIERFNKNKVIVKNTKEPDPNVFINDLTKRINKLKAINKKAEQVFELGNGQISVLVYDRLTRLADNFAKEVDLYTFPINDPNFQKQFKGEMYKISSGMRVEVESLKRSTQNLIEKYELLIDQREESHLAHEVLEISDIRTPASEMAITIGLEK